MLDTLYSLLPTSWMTGETIYIALVFCLPIAAGLLVAWWDWKAVLKAYLTWAALLLISFAFITGGDLQQTMFGTLIFAMFFSVIGVPVIALIWKLASRPRRAQPSEVTP